MRINISCLPPRAARFFDTSACFTNGAERRGSIYGRAYLVRAQVAEALEYGKTTLQKVKQKPSFKENMIFFEKVYEEISRNAAISYFSLTLPKTFPLFLFISSFPSACECAILRPLALTRGKGGEGVIARFVIFAGATEGGIAIYKG